MNTYVVKIGDEYLGPGCYGQRAKRQVEAARFCSRAGAKIWAERGRVVRLVRREVPATRRHTAMAVLKTAENEWRERGCTLRAWSRLPELTFFNQSFAVALADTAFEHAAVFEDAYHLLTEDQ